MVRKTVALLLTLLLATAALMSCGMDLDTPDVIGAGRSKGGGNESLGRNVNLKDMAVEIQGDDTVITLSFLMGSRNSDVAEQKISDVPIYRVSMLEAPARMQVDMNIDYMDYASENERFSDSMITGTFRTIYSTGDHVSLYFQLSGQAEAEVTEQEDKLVIRLSPIEPPARAYDAYFVRLNAYEEFSQSLISHDLGLTPTLAEDLTEITLLSEPFTSEEAASGKAQEVNEAIAGTVPNKSAYVFEMSTDGLPVADREAEEEEVVAQKSVFMKEGTPLTLPVLVENGRYLCSLPDGSIAYARSYIPNTEEDEELVVKEKIWMIETSGKMTELALPDFYSIEEVAASPDGQYLAILDTGIENKVLYVLDMASGVLMNLGEEGFGDYTASFVWDDAQPTIYAMTGYGGALQLTKYDFTAEQYDRISSIEEQNGADSRIALANGKIYFADNTAGENGEGAIYAVDIQTAERVQVADGIEFALAKNGENLVAVTAVLEDEVNLVFDFRLVELGNMSEGGEPLPEEGPEPNEEEQAAEDEDETDAEKDESSAMGGEGLIAEGILPESYSFDMGGNVFYYATRTYEGVTEEFPVALLRYDIDTGKTEVLAYSATGTFVSGAAAGELYIIDSYIRDYNNYYVTYRYAGN
ncbi:MAG: hypothetical protein ACOYJB_03005 [Christensenellaceae bacterium]